MTTKQELTSLKEQIKDLQKLLLDRKPVTVAKAKIDNKSKVYSVNQFKKYTNKTTNKKGIWNYNGSYFNNLDDATMLYKLYAKNTKLGVRISERTAPKVWNTLKTINPKV
jgi:hypothetical protein